MPAPQAAEVVALAWCDLHHDFVDEGRTRPLAAGSIYRACDACIDASRYTPAHPHLVALLDSLDSRALPIEDRAAAYSMLYRLQLLINRRLRVPKEELRLHLEAQGRGARLGPLYLAYRATGVRWLCNEEGNWTDADVQAALAQLESRTDTSAYVKRVPAHRVIDTKALAEAMSIGDEGARALYTEARRAGWRTEDAKRTAYLEVQK